MTTVTTWNDLEAYAPEVTAAEIAKCKEETGPDGQVFWAVENKAGHAFEGETLKYQVRYSSENGFTCTCKGFQYGRLAHPTHTCKHCRWVVAAALAKRAAASQPAPEALATEPAAQETQAEPKAQALKPTPLAPQPNQEEARKQSELDRERRLLAPLNGNEGFRLER